MRNWVCVCACAVTFAAVPRAVCSLTVAVAALAVTVGARGVSFSLPLTFGGRSTGEAGALTREDAARGCVGGGSPPGPAVHTGRGNGGFHLSDAPTTGGYERGGWGASPCMPRVTVRTWVSISGDVYALEV